MKTLSFYSALSLFFVFVGTLLVGCGSFQGTSYYADDGIYNDTPKQVESKRTKHTGGNYYSDYLQNMSDDYSSTSDNGYYTASPNYSIQSNASHSKAPWGSNPTSTEVYIINNRPLWNSWGTLDFSPYYYDYYYSPYRYWGGYSGGFYFGFRGGSNWNFHNRPFYAPSPYYYFPYGNWNYYVNNNRNFYFRNNHVSRVRGHEGEKNYGSSRGTRSSLSRNNSLSRYSRRSIQSQYNGQGVKLKSIGRRQLDNFYSPSSLNGSQSSINYNSRRSNSQNHSSQRSSASNKSYSRRSSSSSSNRGSNFGRSIKSQYNGQSVKLKSVGRRRSGN